jgi:hypothetical protein
MPGNQKPRTRKHRGTQTGSISRASRSRPRSRQEALAQARNRQGGGKRRQPVDRRSIPPTWRSAAIRGVVIAALLFPVSWLILKEDPAQAAVLSLLAAGLYIPLGFYTEQLMYRRYQRKLAAERAAQQQEGPRPKRKGS